MSDKPFDYWAFFANEAERVGAQLYVRLSKGIGGDAQLREFANGVKKGQPPANVLLAAVHYHLLRGTEHPLKRFYPNLNGGKRVEGEDPFPQFKDFVEQHRAELAPLVTARVTNTNEVGRSALLHAGFREVAKQSGEPLNLIEIGPSAGLNMIWDKYGVRYTRGGEVLEVDPRNAELVLDCELRGLGTPPAGAVPKIASRVGLELNPVDLSRREERDWLRALVWPDQVARFARLEKALDIYTREKSEILSGDALALLPDALARIPEDQPVCIYHSYVTYQFTDEMREALDNLLTAASLRRPIWRLGLEGSLQDENSMTLVRYRGGTREVCRLALCHPHGAWLEWGESALRVSGTAPLPAESALL